MAAPTVRDELLEQLARRQVLVVVGSGVSIAATANNAVASWKGLLQSGVARCLARHPELDVAWAGRVLEQIDGDMVNLLCAAENISRRLGAPNGGEYAGWLQDTIGTLRATNPGVLKALSGLKVPLLTTNYDDLIENATGLREVVWTHPHQMDSFVRGASDGVLHLHGHWRFPESVVLGLRSYEDILRSSPAQATLRSLFTLKTLLFVGFGSGLQDPNFGALLEWAAQVFATSMFPSFQLCLDADRLQVQSQHAGRRIVALPYGSQHDDLCPFLQGLCS